MSERDRKSEREEDKGTPTGKSVCVLSPYICVCVRVKGSRAEWELGSAALLSVSGLSEKEFEVEDLRSPLRPHPCSQISC